MGDAARHTSETSYGDAIPGGGWTCRQTYLRNHLLMDAALRLVALSAGGRSEPIRILDAGGGVIEPFLLAALVRARFPQTPCRILVADPSEDVHSLLQATRAGQRWERPSRGETLVGFDSRDCRLPFASLARLFSSPEDPVNTHLIDPVALAGPIDELARLGILEWLGLPGDPGLALRDLVDRGLPTPAESVALIEPAESAFLDLDPGAGPFDLIVANFSLQYPIVEGSADEVAKHLCALLAPGGLFAHGATYAAQVLCAQALLGREHPLRPVAFGVRELDEVHYVDDPEGRRLRLRIRTDAVYCRPSEVDPARAADALFPTFPDRLGSAEAAVDDVVRSMDRADGLTRPRMVACLKSAPGGRCAWSVADRSALLELPRPLPYRIEWRRAER